MFEFNSTTDSTFVSAADLLNPKPVAYLIDQTIETGTLSMLFGAPGMAKSFLAVGWAASIATGTPWLGRDVLQGAVFYLAGEGHAGLARRLRAWEIKHHVKLAGAPLYVSRCPAKLMDQNATEKLVQEIESLCVSHGKPALIIIDTFARNMGEGDENSNADIAKIIAVIDAVKAYLGCAFLVVHHSGHADSSRARGGSSLPAAVDGSFKLHGKEAHGKLAELMLTHIKSKESELFKPIQLEIESIELGGWLDLKGRTMTSAVLVSDTAVRKKDSNPLTPAQQCALNAYVSSAGSHGKLGEHDEFIGLEEASWRDAFFSSNNASSDDAKRKAFKRAVAALMEAGRIKCDGGLYLLLGTQSILHGDFAKSLLQAKNVKGQK